MTVIDHRAAAVLSAVTEAWLSTTDIFNSLYAYGWPWSAQVTRDALHFLASNGKIERRKVGASWHWKLGRIDWQPEPAPVVEPEVAFEPVNATEHVNALVDTIKRLANTLGVPLALLAPPSEQRATDLSDVLATLAAADPDGPDLARLNEALLKRAIRRAAYDMGKALLDVLDGWIEGQQENHEAMGHRDTDCCDTFEPDDIRRMVNDAARVMGAPEPYRPGVTDAAS